MRKSLLTITIYVLVSQLFIMLHQIAYEKSIFETIWVAIVYCVACGIFAEIVSDKILQK